MAPRLCDLGRGPGCLLGSGAGPELCPRRGWSIPCACWLQPCQLWMEPSALGAEQGEAPRCCLLHRLASWCFAALINCFPPFLSFPLHVFLPELDLCEFPKQRAILAQPQGVHSHTTTALPGRAPAWLGVGAVRWGCPRCTGWWSARSWRQSFGSPGLTSTQLSPIKALKLLFSCSQQNIVALCVMYCTGGSFQNAVLKCVFWDF